MGALDRWTLQPESWDCLIVLLDQFPRNNFRGSYKALHFDKKSLALSLEATVKEAYLELPPSMGYFMLIPKMNTESIEAQNIGLKAFKNLASSCSDATCPMIDSTIRFAEAHRSIIERFGLFRHRNQVLDRESCAEEIRFLKEKGSSF